MFDKVNKNKTKIDNLNISLDFTLNEILKNDSKCKISGDILLDILNNNIKVKNNSGKFQSNFLKNNIKINDFSFEKRDDFKNPIKYIEYNLNGKKLIIEDPVFFLINNLSKFNENKDFLNIIKKTNIKKEDIFSYITIAKLTKRDNDLDNLKSFSKFLKNNGYNDKSFLINDSIKNFGKYVIDINLKQYNINVFNILDKETIEQYYKRIFDIFSKQIDNYLDKNTSFLNKIKIKDKNSLIISSFDKITGDTYNSLKMEGYNYTIDDIKEKEMDNVRKLNIKNYLKNKNVDSIFKNDKLEIKGYINAFNQVNKEILNNFESNNKLKDGFLKKINRMLYEGIGIFAQHRHNMGIISQGYRKNDVMITGTEHKPPDAFQVASAMNTFFDLINSIKTKEKRFFCKIDNKVDVNKKELIKKVVLSHYLFTNIHPFYDGNGRTARLLMNFLLGSHGINWIIISSNNKKEYINSLRECDNNNDIIPFTKFILNNIDIG